MTKADQVPPGCPLSKKELAIVALLYDGLTYEQIALEKGIACSTVRTHLHNIYGKLGVPGGAQAAIYAAKAGWLGWRPAPPEPRKPLSAWAKAYVHEFDKWVASGQTDLIAREGMRLAIAGAMNDARRRQPAVAAA